MESAAAPASARAFGWVMAVALLLGSALAFYKGHGSYRWWAIAALLFALLAQWSPKLLEPLNRLWMALGLLLGRIMTPIVMGLIYFGVITPIAVLARWRGVDPLRRNFDRAAKTYWIERDPPGPDPTTMERQY